VFSKYSLPFIPLVFVAHHGRALASLPALRAAQALDDVHQPGIPTGNGRQRLGVSLPRVTTGTRNAHDVLSKMIGKTLDFERGTWRDQDYHSREIASAREHAVSVN
jgi:hypothetical protein